MTNETPVRKLSIPRVLAGAFAIPWQRRGIFIKGLALPGAAIVAIQVGWWRAAKAMSPAMNWVAWGTQTLLWILFAVICHRLVLLEQRPMDVAAVPGWGRRESRFLVWIVVIYVMIMAATLAALTAVGFFVANFSTALVFESIQGYISAAIGTYVFARFTLVLPATAIDSHTSLPRVWRQTRGSNGWKMVVIVGALPWTFGYALSFLYGDEPGSGRMALVTALGTALLVVEIAAISLSYRELDEPGAPEAPPAVR